MPSPQPRTSLYYNHMSGGMFAVEDMARSTGDRFFVDSGNTADGRDVVGAGKSPDTPFLTTDFAIGQCTASNGDIIYVMPGHAETLSTAAQLAIDVVGITIQGIGTRNTKPTYTITTGAVAAPVLWSAAGCVVDNIRIVGGKAGGSNVTIDIADSFNTLSNTQFISTASTELGIGAGLGVITLTDTAGALSEIQLLNVEYMGGAGDDESFLTVNDGVTGVTNVKLIGCDIKGTFADNTIQADQGTNTATLWTIHDCVLANLGGDNLVLTMDTSAVFYITNCNIFGANSTTKPIVGYAASYMSNVWSCEIGAAGGTALIASVTNWGA